MVKLRTAQHGDLEFLFNLKKETMKPYVEKIWGWDELDQRKYLLQNFHPKRIQIITENNQDIGMIEVEEKELEIFLINIQILPTFQNKGIGSLLIKNVIAETIVEKKDFRLQVLKINDRALKLYKTLGLDITGESDTHYKMKL